LGGRAVGARAVGAGGPSVRAGRGRALKGDNHQALLGRHGGGSAVRWRSSDWRGGTHTR
jgi:hypothetical protein